MENIYWLGYKIAFLLELISLAVGLTYLHSTRAKNLEKVGIVFSLSQGKFVEGKKKTFGGNLVGVVSNLIINPFLSWLSILYRLYGYGILISSKLSTPEKIKEIQFKLGSTLLSKDEVKELLKESADFLGKRIEFNDGEDEEIDEDENTLVLDDEGGYYDAVTIEGEKLYSDYHSPYYDTQIRQIHEFKIDGFTVMIKMLEKHVEHPGEEYYEVKDGVVMESGIIERYKAMNIKFGSPEETIEELKKNIVWHELKYYKMKFFILSKSKNIAKNDLKTFFRGELEKKKLSILKVREVLEKYNWELELTEGGRYTCKPTYEDDSQKEKDAKKINKELDEIDKEREAFNAPEIIKAIESYLSTM